MTAFIITIDNVACLPLGSFRFFNTGWKLEDSAARCTARRIESACCMDYLEVQQMKAFFLSRHLEFQINRLITERIHRHTMF